MQQGQIILELEMLQTEAQIITLPEIAILEIVIPTITQQETTIITLLQEARVQAHEAKV